MSNAQYSTVAVAKSITPGKPWQSLVCGLLAIGISIEKSLKHIATKLPLAGGREVDAE